MLKVGLNMYAMYAVIHASDMWEVIIMKLQVFRVNGQLYCEILDKTKTNLQNKLLMVFQWC